MGKVIPLAGTLGLEQEQLFGAMATLTGVTGSTAEVVTQLKATMQGFLSPSKNMQAALASMGYESGQALLESKGLQGALDALKDSVHGDELAFAGLFSSVEAQTAVLAMAGTQSENLASKTAEMYEAAGAADTAFQRQTNTLKYTVQTVKNLGKNFLTQIGTNILPYVNDLAEAALPKVQNALEAAGDYVEKSIIPTAEKAVKWIGENKTAILAVASAAVTAVGAFKALQVATAAIGAVKNLSTIFKAASGGGKILNAVMGMGGVKLAIIAGVIAAVAAGFVLLWNKSEKFRETVMVLWGQLQTLGGALADMAGAIWAKAAPLLEMLGNALLNGLERAVDLLAPVAGNILGIFTGIADFITGVFTGDWDKALQGLQNIFGNALSGLGNLAVAGFTAILEIGTSIWPAIDNAVQAGIAAISSRFPVLGAVLGSLWATVQKVWSNIQVILQNAIQFVQNVFAGNWSGAWQNIVNIFGAIFGTVTTIAMAPLNMLANGVQAAINSVAAFLSEKFPFLGALFSGWAASISAAIENIKAIFSGIIDFVQNVFSGNWSAAWQNIVDIFGNLFGMIVNLAKAPINGVISAINFVLEKINGISVTIPDWVPGVGGTTLGFNIPTIPQLATGGIVTAPTILEAGEGGEAEAILPLSKLAAMLQSVANAPEIPDMGNREDGQEEAPLAQLAKMLDDWTKNKKPDPHGPGQGGGGRDLPDPPRPGGNDAPPPAGGQNPPGGVDTITFAPVFNFYGPTTPEQAKEAGQISFAEFKRMYDRMKAEERRKNLSASTR
jgi:phage-related protein